MTGSSSNSIVAASAEAAAANQSGRAAHEGLYLLLIVLGAIVLRCLAIYFNGWALDRDAALFFNQAESLARGDLNAWFVEHTKPPLYSALLAAGVTLGTSTWTAAKLVSLISGVAILHPAWLFLRRCGQRRTAVLALALVAALKEPVLASSRCISDSTYAVFLFYAAYFLLIRGLIDGRIRGFLWAGLMAGLAYLTRTEGIFFTPLALLLVLVAGLRHKLRPRQAWAAAVIMVITAVVFIAPQVAAVSKKEGRLTFRRNVGQLMLYAAGATSSIRPLEGKGPSPEEVLVQHSVKLLHSWLGNMGAYLSDYIPRAGGYISMLLLVVGLLGDRRSLWQWEPWQLGLAFFVLMVMCLSIVPPHTRFLVGIIALTGWSMARSAEVLSEALVRLNPLRVKRTDAVAPIVAGVCIAAVAGITLGAVIGHDRYDGLDLLAAANVVNDAGGKRGVRVATTEPMVAYFAHGKAIGLNVDWKLTPEKLADVLRQNQAEFMVTRVDQLKLLCPNLSLGNPPSYLSVVKQVPPDPRSKKGRGVIVFRVIPTATTCGSQIFHPG